MLSNITYIANKTRKIFNAGNKLNYHICEIYVMLCWQSHHMTGKRERQANATSQGEGGIPHICQPLFLRTRIDGVKSACLHAWTLVLAAALRGGLGSCFRFGLALGRLLTGRGEGEGSRQCFDLLKVFELRFFVPPGVCAPLLSFAPRDQSSLRVGLSGSRVVSSTLWLSLSFSSLPHVELPHYMLQ